MTNSGDIVEFLTGKRSALGVTAERSISGVNSLESADESHMAFLLAPDPSRLKASKAGLLIAPKELSGEGKREVLFTEYPKYQFAKAAAAFFPPPPARLTISPSAQVHPSAVIGKVGFNLVRGPGQNLVFLPHYAGVTIKDDVSIGANTCVDRGVFEDTVIGRGTRVDNLVHIAHNVKIGEGCQVVAGTVIGGSCVIGNYSFLGIGCMIKDHVNIGNNVMVGMGAVVIRDVPDGVTVVGNPARILT